MHSVILTAWLLCSSVVVLGAPQGLSPSQRLRQHITGPFQNPAYDKVLEKLNFTRSQIAEAIRTVPFKLGPGVNVFGQDLMARLLDDVDNEVKNVVFSPFSVHVALSMLFYASPANSRTHRQIADALGLVSATGDSRQYLFNYLKLLHYYDQIRTRHNAEVKMANRILIKNDFTVKPDFLTVLMGFYLSSVDTFESVDQAEQSVNEYVDLKTGGLIDQLIHPGSLDSLTKLILINVIYYRANWKYQFKKSQTAPMQFNLLGGKEKIYHIQGMNLKAKKLRMADIQGAKVLELPYENTDFNMYVGVPNENSLEALNSLAGNFSYSQFSDSLVTRRFPVKMPAFDAGFSTELKGPLRAMGMEDMFDDYLADFSDMTDEDEVKVGVTKVAHQAVVKVDEEGSEASAATAVVLGSRSGSVLDTPFVVDRPFVFMIHDKVHDIPLFVGRMVNPAGQDNPGATIHHGDVTTAESSAASVQNINAHDSDDYVNSYEDTNEDPENELDDEALAVTEEELPDCGELGYEGAEGPESVSFPCKGRDTFPIERHNQQVERQRRIALEVALKH